MSRRIFLAAVLGIACAIAPVIAEAQYYGTTNVAKGKPVSPVSTPATVNDGKGDLAAPWFASAFTIDLDAEVSIGKIVLSVQQVNLLVISSSLDGVTFVERHRLNMTDPQHANWPDAQANGALVFEADGTYSARYLRYQAFDVGCGCLQLLREFAVYEWVATPPPVLSGNNLATLPGSLVTGLLASASPPTNVADGDLGTSWVGAHVFAYRSVPKLYFVVGWAEIDLGTERLVHGVRVRRPAAGGAQTVGVSLFNSARAEIGWFGDGDPSLAGTDVLAVGDADFVLDVPVQARYVRILQWNPTVSSPSVQPALAEVEVYGEVGQLDRTPPITTATASPGPNGNGWNNATVAVNLSAVDNPGGSGVKEISYTLSGATIGSGTVAESSASVTISAEGTTTIAYFATDIAGNQENPPKTLTVSIDKTAPTISGLPAPGTCTLGPPNHKLVQVANVSASDGLSGLAGSVSVMGSSNEPDNGLGDGDTAPDIVINGGVVQLRAERSGKGNGRLYTLTAAATDLAGNPASAAASCAVPHDQGKK